MVDFENAKHAPRLLDLAIAVLLFFNEATPNPGRLFNTHEWEAFRAGYLSEAPPLATAELVSWPVALDYARLEWGTWHLGPGAEWTWPGQRWLLQALLTLEHAGEVFPWGEPPGPPRRVRR